MHWVFILNITCDIIAKDSKSDKNKAKTIFNYFLNTFIKSYGKANTAA